ncbi:MAG TPA: hypothetical protein VGL47_31655 [Amycolatopsis sp.]
MVGRGVGRRWVVGFFVVNVGVCARVCVCVVPGDEPVVVGNAVGAG